MHDRIDRNSGAPWLHPFDCDCMENHLEPLTPALTWPEAITGLESVDDAVLIVTAGPYQSHCWDIKTGNWTHYYWVTDSRGYYWVKRLPHIRNEWIRLRVWRVLAWCYRRAA